MVEDERTTAYEVELTPKSQRRLETIVRGWRRARHVERCVYLCRVGPTQQAVERAIKRARAEQRVHVMDLRAEGRGRDGT